MDSIRAGLQQLTVMEYPRIVVLAICRGLRGPDTTGVRSPSDMLRVLATIRGDLQFVGRAITDVGSIYNDTLALKDRILALSRQVLEMEAQFGTFEKRISEVADNPTLFCAEALDMYDRFEEGCRTRY